MMLLTNEEIEYIHERTYIWLTAEEDEKVRPLPPLSISSSKSAIVQRHEPRFTKIFYFFQNYDQNLVKQFKFDNDSLYYITRQDIATRMSKCLIRMPSITKHSKILDATACIGGNTMSFCNFFNHIISLDIDKVKCDCLEHNLRVLGLSHQVSVIHENCITFIKNLKWCKLYDIIFFDPPWGGQRYTNYYRHNKNLMLYLEDDQQVPMSMIQVLNLVRTKTKYMALKVPFNFAYHDFIKAIYNIGATYRLFRFDIENRMSLITIKF